MRNDSDEWLRTHDRLNNMILHVEETYNQNFIGKHRKQLNDIIVKVNVYTIYDVFGNPEYKEMKQNLGTEIHQDIKKFEDEMLLAYLSHDS
jgi:hypothetical protein